MESWVELHYERVWILVKLAEYIPLANDLFHTVQVSIRQFLIRQARILLVDHPHNFAFMYHFHSVEFARFALAGHEDFCESALTQYFDYLKVSHSEMLLLSVFFSLLLFFLDKALVFEGHLQF